MNAISAIIKRDLKLAARSGGSWAHGLVFFILFLSVCAIALGGDFGQIRPIAPALVWLALILSLLLSFEHMFRVDSEDGTIAQIKISNRSLLEYVTAKCLVQWTLSVLPIIVIFPAAALLLNLSHTQMSGLLFSLLLASPALICYGAFSAACLVGYKGGGLMIVLLTIPLIVPLLIFGISAVTSYANQGLGANEFLALAGMSLLALAFGLPATSAALGTNLE